MPETLENVPFFGAEFGRSLMITSIGVFLGAAVAMLIAYWARKRDRSTRRRWLASALTSNVGRNLQLLTGEQPLEEAQPGLLPTMETNVRLAKKHRDEGTATPRSFIYFGYFNTALMDATAALKYELGLSDGLNAHLDEFHDGLANLNRLLLIRLQREYVMQRDQTERSDEDTMIDYELKRVASETVKLVKDAALIEELEAAG